LQCRVHHADGTSMAHANAKRRLTLRSDETHHCRSGGVSGFPRRSVRGSNQMSKYTSNPGLSRDWLKGCAFCGKSPTGRAAVRLVRRRSRGRQLWVAHGEDQPLSSDQVAEVAPNFDFRGIRQQTGAHRVGGSGQPKRFVVWSRRQCARDVCTPLLWHVLGELDHGRSAACASTERASAICASRPWAACW